VQEQIEVNKKRARALDDRWGFFLKETCLVDTSIERCCRGRKLRIGVGACGKEESSAAPKLSFLYQVVKIYVLSDTTKKTRQIWRVKLPNLRERGVKHGYN
ncbi:MAG: hypothetical protein V4805_20330, partial [Pseudomonadota bacterium]